MAQRSVQHGIKSNERFVRNLWPFDHVGYDRSRDICEVSCKSAKLHIELTNDKIFAYKVKYIPNTIFLGI